MCIYLTPAEANNALRHGNLDAVAADATRAAAEHRAELRVAFEAGKAAALERRPSRNDHPFQSPLWASYNRGFNLNSRSA
jgi:cell division inhibitor SulA